MLVPLFDPDEQELVKPLSVFLFIKFLIKTRGSQVHARPSKHCLSWIIGSSVVLLLVGVTFIYREHLLTVVGEQLIVAETLDARVTRAVELHLLVFSGDRVEEIAGDYLDHDISDRCLVLHGAPSRVVQLGALPPGVELRIAELEKHDVARDEITVVEIDGSSQWDWAREVAARLRETPGVRLLLLCDQFSSRQLRAIVDQVTSPELAQRVKIVPLPDRRYDETNWWTSRLGVRRVAGEYLSLTYFYLVGEQQYDHPYRTPDEYEEWFLEKLEASNERRVSSGEETAGHRCITSPVVARFSPLPRSGLVTE